MGKCGLNFYGTVIAILYFNYYSNIVVTAGLINSNSKTLTKPDNVEEAKTPAADGQLTSYTNQKTTRLINPDTDNFSVRSRNNKQSTPSTAEAHIGRRPSSRPNAETFDDFPEDFPQGLPPFQFQDEDHRGNPSGFTDFPNEERFPSLASKLGGLKPISSSSRPSSTPSATKTSSTNLPTDEIDPQSEVPSGRPKHHGQQLSSPPEDEFFDPRFSHRPSATDSNRRPSFSPDEHNRPPHPDFANEFQDSRRGRPINGRVRNFEEDFNSESPLHNDRRFQSPRRPSSFHQDQSDDFQTRPVADDSQFQPPAKQSQSVPHHRRPVPDDLTSNTGLDHADGQFENFNEDPATSGKISEKPIAPSDQLDPEFDFPPPSGNPQSDRTRERRPINQQQFSDFPDDSQSFHPKKPSSHSQSRPSGTKFRDSDQFDFSQQQQFVPVTHFNDNPFSFSDFGGFRSPQISNDDQRGFRNSHSHHQQRTPQNFQNQFDNQGFSEVDPNTFNDPTENEQKSNFEDFRGQQFKQDEPESSKGSEFDEHQQSPQQQSTSNDQQRPSHQGEDNINHHSSATNLLGSGNFGVLRGGIFADGDHSNSHSQFQPLGRNSQFHGGAYDDFFDGFRDFQPFGGSLHNALSSQSEKMHKIPSQTSHVHQPHQTSQHDIDNLSSKLDNNTKNSTSVQELEIRKK